MQLTPTIRKSLHDNRYTRSVMLFNYVASVFLIYDMLTFHRRKKKQKRNNLTKEIDSKDIDQKTRIFHFIFANKWSQFLFYQNSFFELSGASRFSCKLNISSRMVGILGKSKQPPMKYSDLNYGQHHG